jgi:membrane-bound inhibitor of C-type lysozyme
MAKYFLTLIILIGVVVVARMLWNGGGDVWICTKTGWVQHGHPSAPVPNTACNQNSTKPVVKAFVFECANGSKINAVFNGQASVDLKLSDGRSLMLPRAVSGSGARYANKDESFVFWNKGDTAFIEEKGQTTYTNCSTGDTGL